MQDHMTKFVDDTTAAAPPPRAALRVVWALCGFFAAPVFVDQVGGVVGDGAVEVVEEQGVGVGGDDDGGVAEDLLDLFHVGAAEFEVAGGAVS